MKRQRTTIVTYLETRVVREGACWIAQGHDFHHGYKRVTVNGQSHAAHRWVYEQLRGPIPAGLEIDHLCRRASCVNPDHLEPVTHAENIRRRYASMTQCSRGHEYTPENLVPDPSRRRCRACHNANRRRRRAELKAPRGVTR